jgi:hypothetical protein
VREVPFDLHEVLGFAFRYQQVLIVLEPFEFVGDDDRVAVLDEF